MSSFLATVAGLVLVVMSGNYSDQMQYLLNEVRQDFEETAGYTGIDRPSEAVMAAMASVPRHAYVPEQDQSQAYFNRPMGIGHGQTISQPFIVALMTHALKPKSADRVLEIGTGSGYQAAVLAELVEHVFTIEIVPELAEQAQNRLDQMGYENIQVRAGDGWHGWPEQAPFDAIIVTAAASEIPPKLIAQLKPGGRMVLPIGEEHQGQMLKLVTRNETGEVDEKNLLPVIFVPFTRAPDQTE